MSYYRDELHIVDDFPNACRKIALKPVCYSTGVYLSVDFKIRLRIIIASAIIRKVDAIACYVKYTIITDWPALSADH